METMSRTCSQCGNNGHNSRTCTSDADNNNGSIMLFGVRLTNQGNNNNNSFRKSSSMTNLSQFDQHLPQDLNATGYVSDDVVHASARSRERKRGLPWTEEEHRLFLLGLQKVGKGDWRGISRNFVKTRTPTQVASHAQKYFLRRHNLNRRRRRSSLFDITTDTVMDSSTTTMELREQVQQETVVPPPTSAAYYGGFSGTAFPIGLSPLSLPLASGERPVKPIMPTGMVPVPPSGKMANLKLKEKAASSSCSSMEPPPLSLKLSPSDHSPASSDSSSSSPSSSSGFQAMSAGKFGGGGDSIISVA